MAVAHTGYTDTYNEIDKHGEEIRSFRSKSSIRGHGKRGEIIDMRLDCGLNLKVSLPPVPSCTGTLFLTI